MQSVLDQTGIDVEVIVVDDGSTDGSPDALRALGDERVRVIENGTSHGVARARNRGIAESRARWVAFLDDDDFWAPRKLQLQVEAAEREGAVLAYCADAVIRDDLKVLRTRLGQSPENLPQALYETNAVGTPSTVLASREVLERVGGFDTAFSACADWDMWLRVSREGRAVRVREILVAYRSHDENMLIVDVRNFEDEVRRLSHKHSPLDPQAPSLFGGLWFWEWHADVQVRAGRRRDAVVTLLKTAVRFRRPATVGLALFVFAPGLERYVGAVSRRVRRLLGRSQPAPPAPPAEAPPPQAQDLSWIQDVGRAQSRA